MSRHGFSKKRLASLPTVCAYSLVAKIHFPFPVNTTQKTALNPCRILVFVGASVFFAACTLGSWNRWANFECRTFDLAFYIQAIWQFIHGRFQVSLLNVPMLGNHADPVVFLLAPLFAAMPHPMLLPAVQIAALACMAPVGWRICRRLGMSDAASALMACALLLTPATGYVSMHEFHPEAFAAPFLLLMIEARLRDSLRWYWIWFFATLFCKENMALLLFCYCVTEWVADRKHRTTAWNLLPGLAALGWFLFYEKILGPALNSGNVEFAALYNHLGNSPGDILLKFFTEPHRVFKALADALTHGNLVWGLLLPFFGLPLLRPRWLLVASPVLLQHLLTWRSSEWTIYYHYAAPLIPLFWFASVEAVRQWPSVIPISIPVACLAVQFQTGPLREFPEDLHANNLWKEAMLAPIPANAGVVASMPYLPHLAMREKLYSLHHILKGLKTLSHSEYVPPKAVDAVVIDYSDSATFSPESGYYHPQMRAVGGRVFPSSDRLLHEFLRHENWIVAAHNGVAIFQRGEAPAQPVAATGGADLDPHTRLAGMEKSGDTFSTARPLLIRMAWMFQGEREIFPWMILRLKSGGKTYGIVKGLCSPEGFDNGKTFTETWSVTPPADLDRGRYELEAVFVNYNQLAWARQSNPNLPYSRFVLKTLSLGTVDFDGDRDR